MSPTNPMGPAAAVAAPHRSVTAITTIVRVRLMWAPRDRARSSPSATALSGRAATTASTTPTRMNGVTVPTISHERLLSVPAPQ
ncbi:hypothetical protein D3C74_368890 [compost metagenome]